MRASATQAEAADEVVPLERREAPAALRAELAASIDRTLQQQARLNEMSIAQIPTDTAR